MSKEKTEIDKAKQANAFHDRGFNCAQSLACVIADTEGLGLGMGCMDGTCGAISAAAVLAGLKCSTGHTDGPDSKAISYEAAASCIRAFKEKNGSLVCRELRGEDTGTPLRSCPGCIEDGVRIIQEHLLKED